MKQLILLNTLVVSLLLTGCAGTALNVQTPYQPTPGAKVSYVINPAVAVPEKALSILRERLTSQLQASSLLASDPEDASRTAEISIVNYYMRHGATRAIVGIMAGVDNIQSAVVVRDAKTQTTLGESMVKSKNPTAWWTSRGMIEEHADKIVQYLKSGGK